MPLPETKTIKLYRFEKNEKERCETISNKQLWISAPSEFNDLDDCRIRGIFGFQMSHEEHEKIMNGIKLFYPDESKLENEVLSQETLNRLKTLIYLFAHNGNTTENRLYASKAWLEITEEIKTATGIRCFFGACPDNALMWAHYADNHKGFCIEYEVDIKTPGLLEVTYSSKLSDPSVTELLFSPEETFRRILTTKKIEWNYEKEWRLVYLRALSPEEKGKNIKRPDSIKPVRIITGAKYNPNQKTDENFAVDMAKKMGIDRLTYLEFKEQIEKTGTL